MVQITVAAIGALGTIISAYILFQVNTVKTVVNGRNDKLEKQNAELRAEVNRLESQLRRRRHTDRRTGDK